MISLETIRSEIIPLAIKYDVKNVDLFGSYATGCASEASDVDFLVSFVTPVPSIFKVMGFKEELSRRLGLPVDVVTTPLSRPMHLDVGTTIPIYEK